MPLLHVSSPDARPSYRVAVFGLAQKLQRVLEIVLRHARHNPYRFELAAAHGPADYDIAMVDMTSRTSRDVAGTLMRLPRQRPVVKVGRRSDARRGNDDLLLGSFTVDVLKALNRVVDPRRSAPAQVAAGRLPLDAGVSGASGALRASHPGGGLGAGAAGPRPAGMMAMPAYMTTPDAPAAVQPVRMAHIAEPLPLPGLTPSRLSAAAEHAAGTMQAIERQIADRLKAERLSAERSAAAAQAAHATAAAAHAQAQAREQAFRGLAQDHVQPEPVRPRAIVVDDSPTVRRQLALALAQLGIDCDAVATAEEALDMLSMRRFDLMFVDVVLPLMDGYRLTREIRRDRALRAMPVTILTTRSSPFDLARGALAGCTSYLVKPVSLRTLHDTVQRQLTRTGRMDWLPAALRAA